MAIATNESVPTFFAENFVTVDESDAASADFQAPKKENRWCLVELPKDHLEALEAGELFHIKAHSMGHSGNAALSTGSQTFGLEFLENSNPMYLGSVAEVAPKEANKEAAENKDPNNVDTVEAAKPSKLLTIFGQCRGHILLKPSCSDVQRVRDLLVPNSIEGVEGAAPSDSEPVTTSLLKYKVAASPKELKTILEEGPYVERDGVWAWLPANFEREVTDVSLTLISLNSWDLSALDVKALLRAVQEHFGEDGVRYVPSEAVLTNALRGVVRDPAKPTEGQTGEAAPMALEEGKIALDQAKIDLFQATQLLRESPSRLRERFDLPAPAPRAKRPRTGAAAAAGGGSALQVEEFCAAFSALTGKETTIEELCKIVGDRMYVDEMDGAVHTLDVTTLPQEPRERLKRLFELSSHWRPDRLASLMLPTVKGIKIESWLMKQTKGVYLEPEKGKEVRMLTAKFAMLH